MVIAGGEGHDVAAHGRVVARRHGACRSAVAQLTVTVWPLAARQGDGEGGADGAGVALGHGHVVDRDASAAASSSVIVPTPWPSAMVALVGAAQVDEERLVGLVEQCRRWTGDGDRLRGHAGREGERRRRHGRVVARAPRRVPSAVA